VTEQGSDHAGSRALVGQPLKEDGPPVREAVSETARTDTQQPGDAPGKGRHARPPSRNWQRFVLEWLAVLLVAVGVAVGVRAFVFQTFYIPSASMEPTLMIGDRIIVNKLSYDLHGVGRGDIVVFAKPPEEVAPPGVKDLVKRVIGLPGETISSADGQVWINGKPLKEPWLPRGTVTTGIRTQKIPPNEYFVMGDNRGDSQDSRFFGPISRSLIVGKVVFRIWPFSRFGFL
jgi:signal peptidase I